MLTGYNQRAISDSQVIYGVYKGLQMSRDGGRTRRAWRAEYLRRLVRLFSDGIVLPAPSGQSGRT